MSRRSADAPTPHVPDGHAGPARALPPAPRPAPQATDPLLTAAARGDRQALRDLWHAHRRWVAAILLAHKPRETDLEDLLQDVAATLAEHAGRVQGPLRPWLRAVAVNAARADGRRRSRDRRLRLVRPPPEPVEPTPPDDEAQAILDLARRLPEAYREPLLLRCLRGMSHREIGRVLDLPETTVETRIARGRRMLRELIAQSERAPASATPGVPHPRPSAGRPRASAHAATGADHA